MLLQTLFFPLLLSFFIYKRHFFPLSHFTPLQPTHTQTYISYKDFKPEQTVQLLDQDSFEGIYTVLLSHLFLPLHL